MQKVVILGCGFVGKYLVTHLQDSYDVFATSRNPKNFSNDNNLLKTKNILHFDLEDNQTFKNIPNNSLIIWNFPAQPFNKVQDFYNYCVNNSIDIKIVYGSTSAYVKKSGEIDENDLTDESISRVKCENYLLNQGVNVLQLSGIYDQIKNPFNWLNRGMIKNSNKTVNLINAQDIAKITKIILEIDLSGERINISDGENYLWKNLWQLSFDKKIVNTDCPPFLNHDYKYISNKKLLSIIGNYNFEKLI